MTPFMSPPLPPCWTPEINQAALDHANERVPDEAAGIVEGGEYVRLDNRAAESTEEVALTEEDMLRVAGAEVFFHSHPNGLGCPSAADMRYQQQLGIPFVIAALPQNDVFAFGDQLGHRPLIGRGFRHGVHDCYAVIRDWYREKLGIDLEDGQRDWEWWNAGRNLYMDNFRRAGFREVTPGDARKPGDILLFRFNHKVPMHGGVIVDAQLMLHHPAGLRAVDPTRISGLVQRSRYAPLITVALRHASNAA